MESLRGSATSAFLFWLVCNFGRLNKAQSGSGRRARYRVGRRGGFLKGFRHVGFFLACGGEQRSRPPETDAMGQHESNVEQQIAEAVSVFQKQSTGHAPKAVTVVLSEDTLVTTLHEALTPAEQVLAKSADGAAQVQEFHRQLFASSSESLRQDIQRITGRQVRDAVEKLEPTTGSIVHAFTTGTMVQVFLLTPDATTKSKSAVSRASEQH